MRHVFTLTIFSFLFLIVYTAAAQDTSQNKSINPELLSLLNSKQPKRYTIADIKVTGIKNFDPNLVRSISGLAIGDQITIPGTDVFNKAINRLWNQDLIGDVVIYITNIVGDKIYIEIEATERPRLNELLYNGISKSQQDDLAEKSSLKKDKVVTEDAKLSELQNIRKFFTEKGYRLVEVTYKELPAIGQNNMVNLIYDINKGNKVKINNINFTDNENITDATLKSKMKGTTEMSRITLFPAKVVSPYGDSTKRPSLNEYFKNFGYLYPTASRQYFEPYVSIKLFKTSKFNQTKYAEDKDKVITYYNSQGFRDANVVDDTVFYDSKKNLNIDIKVAEGKKYYFGNIVWKGNSKYSDSVLNLILGIRKGDVYDAELLSKRLGTQVSPEGGDVGSLYQDDGYLFFTADPIETAVYNDTIDFELRLREGPQASYGKITVSGNTKTKDYVILREVRTVPGEKYSRQDIFRTQRELSQLGFLNPEKINPQITPDALNGTVDINWEVEEKSADQLELSAGFGGNTGFVGTVGVSFSNFSIRNILKKDSWDPLPTGDGQRLSLRVQANRSFRSVNFSFMEPWLGGKKRNSFTISYYNTKFSSLYDPNGGIVPVFTNNSYIKTSGVSVALGKQLKWPDDYFNLIYSLNFQQYKLKNYINSPFEGFTDGTSNSISLKVSLVRNSAGPNPMFPTSGSNFAVSGQFTLPYSLLGITKDPTDQYTLPEFHKWRFLSEWFVPIGKAKGEERNKQFVFRAAVKWGFIGRYSHKTPITPFERFQVGDAGLNNQNAFLGYDIIAHRGYPVYVSSDPKVNPENISTNQNFTMFNKYTLELRYPFSTAASSTIYGLLFFEAANGWYSFKDYNPFRLRRSAGVGARFFLPMFGLLGFDYGMGFDRYTPGAKLSSTFKFTFMLGQEPE